MCVCVCVCGKIRLIHKCFNNQTLLKLRKIMTIPKR